MKLVEGRFPFLAMRFLLRGVVLALGMFFSMDSAAEGAGDGAPYRLDLIDRFPVARSQFDIARVASPILEDSEIFSGGWSPVESRSGGRWTESRVATVDVSRSEPADGLLRLRVTAPPVHEELEAQRLRVAWNGKALGSFNLEPEVDAIEVPVPADVQRLGPNRLTLAPSYMIWLDAPDKPAKRRRVGVRLESLDFVQEKKRKKSGLRPARVKGRRLEQRLDSVITYALKLPEGAVLEGRASVGSGLSEAARKGATLKVVLATDDGQRVLWERPLDSLGKAPEGFSIDLEKWQRQPVELGFLVSGGEAWEEGVAGVWSRLEVTGHGEGESPELQVSTGAAVNVMIVLFDTLRADGVEPYGAEAGSTPSIAALAQEGVTFDNAIAPSSWTRSSVASMLTGVGPAVHGTLDKSHSLGTEIPVLPEMLREAGYTTSLVTGNLHLGPRFGFGRGFDQIHEAHKDYRRVRRRHPSPADRADVYWERYVNPVLPENTGRPFFLYLHELDPHSPYEPLPPYAQESIQQYPGSLDERYIISRGYRFGLVDLEQADIDYMRSLYQGEIQYMDRFLQRILEKMESSGLRNDTLVVFLSDHGEEFGEHRSLGHGDTLFEESIRIPMIWSLPGVLPQGTRSVQPASLIDVPPTVLELLGLPVPADVQGESLVGVMMQAKKADPQRPLYAKLKDSHDSLRSGRWKIIRNGRRSDSFELYDLERDPGETLDLWSVYPVEGAVLKQELQWKMLLDRALKDAQPPVPVSEDLDPETEEQLRALGYL